MSTVYRAFNQEALDKQYNAQATVGDISPFIKVYTAESKNARSSLLFEDSLSFGMSPEEILDLFPAGEGAPLLIFIHGGYWRALSKNESSFMAPCMVGLGLATASVNYTLRPQATLDEIVAEVRRAISWLYRQGGQYGYDPERMFIAGSSAGGHLAGMAISRDWHEEFGVPLDVIKGGILLSGLYDLEPVRLSYANEWMGLDESSAYRNSPLFQLPESGCPLILSYGGSETEEFKRQSEDYASAWQSAGFEAESFEVSECNHFDIPLELTKSSSVLTSKLIGLIERV